MKDDKSCGSKLSTCNFAVASAVVWGLYMGVMVLYCMTYNAGKDIITSYGQLFHGVALTYQGAFIALLWGLLQGYVVGFVFSKVYNYCYCCCPCAACKMCRK